MASQRGHASLTQSIWHWRDCTRPISCFTLFISFSCFVFIIWMDVLCRVHEWRANRVLHRSAQTTLCPVLTSFHSWNMEQTISCPNPGHSHCWGLRPARQSTALTSSTATIQCTTRMVRRPLSMFSIPVEPCHT